jgi:transcription initiation factor IIE alpha subunit
MTYKVVHGNLGAFFRCEETNEDLSYEEVCDRLNSTESVLKQLSEELDKVNSELNEMTFLYNPLREFKR